MTPLHADDLCTLYLGDCLEVMRELPAESVDAIVTDPPYGLEFMGKEWDRLQGYTTDIGFKSMTLPRQRKRNVKCPDCGKYVYDHEGRRCECGGVRRLQVSTMQAWHEAWAREAFRVAKPRAHLLAFGGTRTYHRLASAIEDAGWEIRDCLVWAYASGFPKSLNFPDGFGTALKPAWEPIVMTRRPLIGTVSANRERHGTGALNIDATRIGTAGDLEASNRAGHSEKRSPMTVYREGTVPMHAEPSGLGRWPANLLLTDPIFDGDTPGVVGGGDAGVSTGGQASLGAFRNGDVYGVGRDERWKADPGYGDSGTYSRFFLIPKAARSDREPLVRGGPERVVSVWGGDEDDLTPGKKSTIARANTHPTVKPLDLMRHLVRLVTPPGGTVLDPFLGSGTTAIAANAEGFRCIGIEREREYLDIALARMAHQPLGMAL